MIRMIFISSLISFFSSAYGDVKELVVKSVPIINTTHVNPYANLTQKEAQIQVRINQLLWGVANKAGFFDRLLTAKIGGEHGIPMNITTLKAITLYEAQRELGFVQDRGDALNDPNNGFVNSVGQGGINYIQYNDWDDITVDSKFKFPNAEFLTIDIGNGLGRQPHDGSLDAATFIYEGYIISAILGPMTLGSSVVAWQLFLKNYPTSYNKDVNNYDAQRSSQIIVDAYNRSNIDPGVDSVKS